MDTHPTSTPNHTYRTEQNHLCLKTWLEFTAILVGADLGQCWTNLEIWPQLFTISLSTNCNREEKARKKFFPIFFFFKSHCTCQQIFLINKYSLLWILYLGQSWMQKILTFKVRPSVQLKWLCSLLTQGAKYHKCFNHLNYNYWQLTRRKNIFSGFRCLGPRTCIVYGQINISHESLFFLIPSITWPQ